MTRPTTAQLNAAYDQFNFWYDKAKKLDEELAKAEERIAELEAKLAAPVRLPLPYSPDPWMSPDPDGTWLDKEDVKKSIRAAGFVVELCSACNERYCGNCAHANGAKVQ
ncbi:MULTISPECIES: ABC transporter C-terminal domain-containing protein [Serratia]|uniref:ABC transporter C-terminal domain-containing protein n=1 Tax=Serratia TaxID=613 RepID=UPI000B5E86E9|nr:ABC transporter C-terminal domain-containing protein [Serratia marcescens]ASL94532.1 hypothetical protein BVG94_18570 [Serratia marcescens]QDI49372.1 hypothetical protein FG173_22045 [Serratia marcescens]BBG71248.1 hypothetical protein SERAS_40510 [Serratia marcescens]